MSERARELRVGGFVPFTATDYPDALAAVVFCQGCPWWCAYCHNPHLIPATPADAHDMGAILDWLGTRRGLLDAVVFSGGEPTAQAELADAIGAVDALGFAVGLHTSGAYPRRLAEVLPQVSWVGIDVKAPQSSYAAVTGIPGSGGTALASLDLVLAAGNAYEVRTTVHPGLTDDDDLTQLARELASRNVIRWIVQPFRPMGCANESLVAAAPGGAKLDEALLSRLSAYVPIIEIRG
ncbi:MAG TPA: anaerobic ribonucleoside-triphosphate reductase activating protein [Casimicrobiaceae bacterium]|nr:anaerobic ribonucleoside-triphosphate reductase activating protein [Casimicrobiaceae bacterium]